MDNKVFDFHEIKTFEDACKRLGLPAEALTVESFGVASAFLQENALYKLLIIQKAMNNDKCRDEDGLSYHPYWVLYSKEEMERKSEEVKQRKGIHDFYSYYKRRSNTTIFLSNEDKTGKICKGRVRT